MSKKIRMPRDPKKAARRRSVLTAAAEYKRAREKCRHGTLGPASKVRRIDPATGLIIPD